MSFFFRDEWNYRWEGFIGKEFGLKIEDEGIRLLRKYGINMNDVRDSIKRKEVKFSSKKIFVIIMLFLIGI